MKAFTIARLILPVIVASASAQPAGIINLSDPGKY
jgi:hypothetical protein